MHPDKSVVRFICVALKVPMKFSGGNYLHHVSIYHKDIQIPMCNRVTHTTKHTVEGSDARRVQVEGLFLKFHGM